MRLALRVAAQLEQGTRLAVKRVDAQVDEFDNMTRFSALPVKQLSGCVPGAPPPAKRRLGETLATPPPGRWDGKPRATRQTRDGSRLSRRTRAPRQGGEIRPTALAEWSPGTTL